MTAAAFGQDLRLQLPDGDAGVIDTLWIMAALADDAVESPSDYMTSAIWHLSRNPTTRERILSVYRFLEEHVVFRRDPKGLEHVRHPDQLLAEIEEQGQAQGDCDENATLGAALLKGLGIRPAFVVVSTRPGKPFHHVFFAARLGDRWMYLDPQERIIDRMPEGVLRSQILDWS